MLRPPAVSGQHRHRQQIEKALEKTRESVLADAAGPGPVQRRDLSDVIAAGRREYRDEAVELTIDAKILGHFAPHDLEPADMIVQPDAGQPSNHLVEHPRRVNLVPRVVSNPLPAADQVEAFVELGQQTRHFLRGVLHVGVHHEDHVTAGGGETGHQGRRLATVAPEPQAADALDALGKRYDLLPARIAAAVIDQDDFDFQSVAGRHVTDLRNEPVQRVDLVVHRHHNADQP